MSRGLGDVYKRQDLILPVSVAIHSRLTVDRLAQAFSIYPSFGGSVQEAARRLMR